MIRNGYNRANRAATTLVQRQEHTLRPGAMCDRIYPRHVSRGRWGGTQLLLLPTNREMGLLPNSRPSPCDEFQVWGGRGCAAARDAEIERRATRPGRLEGAHPSGRYRGPSQGNCCADRRLQSWFFFPRTSSTPSLLFLTLFPLRCPGRLALPSFRRRYSLPTFLCPARFVRSPSPRASSVR